MWVCQSLASICWHTPATSGRALSSSRRSPLMQWSLNQMSLRNSSQSDSIGLAGLRGYSSLTHHQTSSDRDFAGRRTLQYLHTLLHELGGCSGASVGCRYCLTLPLVVRGRGKMQNWPRINQKGTVLWCCFANFLSFTPAVFDTCRGETRALLLPD